MSSYERCPLLRKLFNAIFSWTKKLNINYRCFIYDCKKLLNNKICLKVKKKLKLYYLMDMSSSCLLSVCNIIGSSYLCLLAYIDALCCQFLWIVYFWMRFRYSLTFISIVPLIAYLIFYCHHYCLRRSCLSLIFHIKFFSETTETS